MNLNEEFVPIKENMKFEALGTLREIQSSLVGISFLPVIAIMKETNPLKKSVHKFQDDLDKLTIDIQEFISKAKNDVEYETEEEPDDAEGEEETEEEPEEKEPEEKEPEEKEPEEKEDETDEEPEDSSKPKEK